MSQDNPQESSNQAAADADAADMQLDLPAEMFRQGDRVERAVLQMQRKNYGIQYTHVSFTEIGDQAVFEGDIILGNADDVRGVDDPSPLGIGIVGEEYRWPTDTIPYVVTDKSLRPMVEAAIAHWRQHTPFKFVERTTEGDYISFKRLNGCYSQVGRRGKEQVISLGTGCSVGSAIHEIGHALGLWHEQSRSDRDNYIEIVWANIDPNQRHNFDKHVQDGQDLGDYDCDSIMHYPATAFSINGQPTIKVRGGEPIGQRNGLSKGDIAAIRMMYPTLNWPKTDAEVNSPTADVPLQCSQSGGG